jgi:hypothetical protein
MTERPHIRLTDQQFAEIAHWIPLTYQGFSLSDPEVPEWVREWLGEDGGTLSLMEALRRERHRADLLETLLNAEMTDYEEKQRQFTAILDSDKQDSLKGVNLDFSEFHDLAHWPGIGCIGQYGGVKHHLKLAWAYQWSGEMKRLTLCRLERHEMTQVYDGDFVPIKRMCRNCCKDEKETCDEPTPMTALANSLSRCKRKLIAYAPSIRTLTSKLFR